MIGGFRAGCSRLLTAARSVQRGAPTVASGPWCRLETTASVGPRPPKTALFKGNQRLRQDGTRLALGHPMQGEHETTTQTSTPELSRAIEELAGDGLEAVLTASSQANFYAGLEDPQPRGVFVPTWLSPKVGSKVTVTVTLPGLEPFELAGVVEWGRDTERATTWPGIGIRFPVLASDVRSAIRRFSAQRAPILFES